MKEPVLMRCAVREGDDEWHIECRFSDGQKYAAIKLDGACPQLATRVAALLNGNIWTDERPSEPGEYWVSIEPSKRQETQKFLLLAKMRPVERVTLLVAVGCGKELDGELLVNFRSEDTTFPMFLKCFDGAKWSRRETPADPFEVTA